jgi:DNA-binding winged helix-turn-helix (wHTH) protein
VAEPLDAARRPLRVVTNDDEAFADFVESWLRRQGLKAVPLGGGSGGAVPQEGRGRSSAVAIPVLGGPRDDPWDDTARAGPAGYEPTYRPIEFGRLVLDLARRTVHVAGVQVHLTPTEFRLLRHFLEHPDRLIGHKELLGTVWGHGYEDDVHLLQVTMRSLRARIALVTDETLIETVYGAGYRMVELGDIASRGRPALP